MYIFLDCHMVIKQQNNSIIGMMSISILIFIALLRLDMLLDSLLFIHIFLLVTIGFLLQKLFPNLLKPIMKFKKFWFVDIFINIVFFAYVLVTVYLSIYFYNNYNTGYYYVILFILGLLGIIQIVYAKELLINMDLLPFNLLVSSYLSCIFFTMFFAPQILVGNTTNLIELVIDLVLLFPFKLIMYTTAQTLVSGQTLFILQFFLVTLISGIIFFMVLSRMTSKLALRTNLNEKIFIRTESISKIPFFSVILLLALLQQANGVTKFLNLSLYLLCILFILFELLSIKKQYLETIQFERLRLVLWLTFVMSSLFIFENFWFFQPIINMVSDIITDQTIMPIFIFMVVINLLAIILHYTLTNIRINDKARIIHYFEIGVLGFFILNIPQRTIILALLSLFVVILVILKQSQISKNSITSNNSISIIQNNQKYNNALNFITEILIYFVIFQVI